MAKRLNTPFVATLGTICTAAIVAVIMTGFIKKKIAERPKTEMATVAAAKAEELLKEGKFAEARDQITLAHMYDPHNKEYCLRRGDILLTTTGEEGLVALSAARKSWQDALEIDPNFKPALSHLLDSYIDQIEVTGSAQGSVILHETAAHLLRVDKDDGRAHAYLHIATVQQWGLGNIQDHC